MKAILYLFMVSFIFLSSQSHAQSSEMSYSNGIRAGWHYAGMFRSGTQKFSNLNSFYVGLFGETRVSENWSGGSGLEYFQNGFENGNGNFRMHTISLPIYVKPNIGPVYGTAGLALNFKLGDNREDFPNVVTETKFFDIPLTLGAGVELGPVIIEAKYYWGLFNAAYIDGKGHKNQYLQAGLGFKF